MEDGDGPLDEKGFVSFNAGCIEGEDALEVVRTLKADPDFAAALKKYDMELRETPTFRQTLIHHHGDFEGLYFETNWEGVKGPCKQVFPRGKGRAVSHADAPCQQGARARTYQRAPQKRGQAPRQRHLALGGGQGGKAAEPSGALRQERRGRCGGARGQGARRDVRP